MSGYLVAQDDDRVLLPSGVDGMVEECRSAVYRDDGSTSATARECRVRLHDGTCLWVHADHLEVLSGGGSR